MFHIIRSYLIFFLLSFTVHGFRYLSIFGPPNSLTADDIECPVVHSETTLKGHFTTSNPIINQIQHNIQWGQLSNLMSLPTDWYV
jgi:alpha-L-rhamnosidase